MVKKKPGKHPLQRGIELFAIVVFILLLLRVFPDALNLRGSLVPQFHGSEEIGVKLIRKWHPLELQFIIYNPGLVSQSPADIAIRLFPIQRITPQKDLLIQELRPQDISALNLRTGHAELLKESDVLLIRISEMEQQAEDLRGATNLGSIAIRIPPEDYLEMNYEVEQSGRRKLLKDVNRSYTSVNHGTLLRNGSIQPMYLQMPGEQRVLGPGEHYSSSYPNVAAYTLLFPGHLSIITLQNAEAHSYRSASQQTRELPSFPLDELEYLDGELIVPVQNLSRFNTLIVGYGHDEQLRYKLFSIRNGKALKAQLPWSDMPDIYQKLNYHFAMLDESEAGNAALQRQKLDALQPEAAVVNYLSPEYSLLSFLERPQVETHQNVSFHSASPGQILVVGTKPYVTTAHAYRDLLLNQRKIYRSSPQNQLISTRHPEGTPLHNSVLSRQASIISAAAADRLRISLQPELEIPEMLEAEALDPKTYLAHPDADEDIICLIEEQGEWRNLVIPKVPLKSPLQCWNSAKELGYGAGSLQFLRYKKSSSEFALDPPLQYFVPSGGSMPQVTRFSADTLAASLSSRPEPGTIIHAIFYHDLNLSESSVSETRRNGLELMVEDVPNTCRTGSCVLRFIAERNEGDAVFLEEISPFLHFSPGTERHYSFCMNGLAKDLTPDDWTLEGVAASRVRPQKTPEGCLSYKVPQTPTTIVRSAPMVSSLSSTTAPLRVRFSDNLLANASLESNTFRVHQSQMNPRDLETGVWYKSPEADWNSSTGREGSGGVQMIHSAEAPLLLMQKVPLARSGSLLRASGYAKADPPPFNNGVCKMSLRFLDAGGDLLGSETQLSFIRSQNFERGETETLVPDRAVYALITFKSQLIGNSGTSICAFDEFALQAEVEQQQAVVVPQVQAPPLPGVAQQNPPGIIFLSNQAEEETDNPYISHRNLRAWHQTHTLQSDGFSHRVFFIQNEASHIQLEDDFGLLSLPDVEAADVETLGSFGTENRFHPRFVGSNLFMDDWRRNPNPFEDYKMDSPRSETLFYPRDTPGSTLHLLHSLRESSLLTEQNLLEKGTLKLSFHALPNAAANVNLSGLLRDGVRLDSLVPDQVLSWQTGAAIRLRNPLASMSIPSLVSLNVAPPNTSLITLRERDVPPDAGNPSIPIHIVLEFRETTELPYSSTSMPITLTPAIRGEVYAHTLPYATLIPNVHLEVSNLSILEPDCARVINWNHQNLALSGNIPTAFPLRECSVSWDLSLTESSNGASQTAVARTHARVPITSDPPPALIRDESVFLPQNGVITPHRIAFSEVLEETLIDGEEDLFQQNGIQISYSESNLAFLVSGNTSGFGGPLMVRLTGRMSGSFREVEVNLRLIPMRVLRLPVPLARDFENRIALDDLILAHLNGNRSSTTTGTSGTLPFFTTTQSSIASSTSTSTTSALSTTAASSLYFSMANGADIKDITFPNGSLPGGISFLRETHTLIVEKNAGLTPRLTLSGRAAMGNEQITLELELQPYTVTPEVLNPEPTLRGAALHLGLSELIRKNTRSNIPFPRFSVESPTWLTFNGLDSVRGIVPSGFQSDTLIIRELTSKRIYRLALQGADIPLPSTTVPPQAPGTSSTGIPPQRTPSTAPHPIRNTSTTLTTVTSTTTSTTNAAAPTSLSSTPTSLTTTAPLHLAPGECFPDITPLDAELKASICRAKTESIISGSGGNFNPGRPINRAEATKILITGIAIPAGRSTQQRLDTYVNEFGYYATVLFSDVPGVEWYMPFVAEASRLNIVSGYPDGSFKPSQLLNKAEAAKLVLSTFLSFAQETSLLKRSYTSCQNPENEWYEPYVRVIELYGDELSKQTFKESLENPISRADFVHLIITIGDTTKKTGEAKLCAVTE